MTAGQQCESDAFDALLSTRGESLSFREGTVQALVRRPQDPNSETALPRYGGASNGALDFSVRDHSRIVIRDTALTPIPAAGESFVDNDGRGHRVKEIFRIPGFLKLVCKVV